MRKRNLLKLLGAIVLAAVLAIAFVPGCAAPEEAPTPAPAPAPEPAEEVIHWKVSLHPGPTSGSGEAAGAWAEFMEERTDGRFKAELYYSGELLGAKDVLEGVQAGVADAGLIGPHYYPGAFPIHLLMFAPGMAPWRADVGGWARREWVKHPLVKAELDNNKVVYIAGDNIPPTDIIGTKPIRNVEDLKGVKIRAGAELADLLKKFGAVPIMIPWGDQYTALDTGLLDANLTIAGSIYPYHVQEVCDYWIEGFSIAANAAFIGANKDSFNALPDDIKDIMLGDGCEFHFKYLQYYFLDPDKMDEIHANLLADGIEIIQFPPEERDKLVAGCEDIWEAWIEKNGGEPAREVMEHWQTLLEETENKYPEGILPLYKP